MSAPQIEAFRPFAEHLARLACQTVLGLKAGAVTEFKPDGSPVTSVDRGVEAALRLAIETHHPEHGIVGEEYGNKQPDAEWVWVLDPIDGTRSFVAGLPSYGVLIALCHGGTPLLGVIAQPETSQVYLGMPGIGAWLNGSPIRTRQVTSLGTAFANLADVEAHTPNSLKAYEALRQASRWNIYDGSCLGYGALAAGKQDICLSGTNLDNYDLCALVAVVGGAGGAISDWQGGALGLASRGAILAAATPALHAELLDLVAKACGPAV